MKILVLCGGISPERDVSLSSGAMIATALSKRGHSVACCDSYIGFEGDADAQFKTGAEYSFSIPEKEPDLAALREKYGPRNGSAELNPAIIDACRLADVVFIALHGGIGENGQLQATFDTFGIRYTGSAALASAMAMDKDISKRMFVQSGVPTAAWVYFDMKHTQKSDAVSITAAEIGFPCVVKPVGCGSSVGVSMVNDVHELDKALAFAESYEGALICEKMVRGREFSVGVLDGRALPVIEIVPKCGWYDYKNKYQSGSTTEITPAPLDDALTLRVQELAEKAHRALRLGGYSRADFILDERSGDFICLEINNLPGMCPTSLIPQEAAAAGISYGELCELICRLGLQK